MDLTAKKQAIELLPLFVYGTLQRGAPNPWSRRLWADAVFVGEGRVRGRLYSLNGYPGMVDPAEAEDFVWGQVIRPADARHLMPALDQYEGDMFERLRKRAILESGAQIEVWAWVYQGIVSEAGRIRSGRYEPV